MNSHIASLMSLPAPAMISHILRVQIAQINALRATLVLLRDDGSHDPRAGRAYETLTSQVVASINELYVGYLNGHGETAQAMRNARRAALAVRPKLNYSTDEGVEITTEEGLEELIRSQLPVFNAEGDAKLDGEWTSQIRVTLGAGFDGFWNTKELDRLRRDGKIPELSKSQFDVTTLFCSDTGDSDPESGEPIYEYGIRICVESDNRTVLTMISGVPDVHAATWIPLEGIWAQHTDGRLTDIALISGLLDTYFTSIGLTEPLPAPAVTEALDQAVEGFRNAEAVSGDAANDDPAGQS